MDEASERIGKFLLDVYVWMQSHENEVSTALEQNGVTKVLEIA